MADETPNSNVDLATSLTIAWLSNPHTRASAEEVRSFMTTLHRTVSTLSGSGADQAQVTDGAPTEYTPAVSVRKSLASPDHIISMIDGKAYKTLRRHLSTNGLTPEEYRARYGLKADYPMVAPSYSEARRSMAKTIGLGRKPGESPKRKAAEAPASKARGRAKSISEAKAAAAQHLNGDADA